MLTLHLALIDRTSRLGVTDLLPVAAALQKQFTRDVGPIWGVDALISAFANLQQVPADYWPIIVADNIDAPGAAGYHSDANNQPFALVQYDPDWAMTASHEAIEMAIDPFGSRLRGGSIEAWGSARVRFLVEACDPCEMTVYTIDGVRVSDFITPHFYDPDGQAPHPYTFLQTLSKPRTIAFGGYLSFLSKKGEWYQELWFSGPTPTIEYLGPAEALPGRTPREKIDNWSRENHPRLKVGRK